MTDPGCFWHGEEPIPPGAYLVCGECGHYWPTVEDFTVGVQMMLHDINIPEDAIKVPITDWPYCPLCAHDF